ncbi:MAG: phosphonate metabolism protein/1,5-bisphosphokinase (PRPP-forming) PhnN [Pseudomonadota bacterium]
MRGTLFLVVGPSGVGKDTLIEVAAKARPDLLVPMRTVTRPVASGGETIRSLTPGAFDAAEAAGAFMLSWRAHGLAYGVPRTAAERLAAGQDVLVNVSRSVVAAARAAFQPVRVLAIVAPAEVLAARLAARGREPAEDIARRLAQSTRPVPDGDDVILIQNAGTLETAVAAFLAALQPESACEAK